MSSDKEEITNLASFYTIDEEGTEELSGTDPLSLENGVEIQSNSVDNLRIEANLYAHWSGTKNCRKKSRARDEIKSVLTRWSDEKRKEHSELTHVRRGLVGKVKFKWQTRTDWNGRRSCKGWAKFRVYIEFSKP